MDIGLPLELVGWFVRYVDKLAPLIAMGSLRKLLIIREACVEAIEALETRNSE